MVGLDGAGLSHGLGDDEASRSHASAQAPEVARARGLSVAAKDVVLLVLLGWRGHLLPLALPVRQRGPRRARHTYKRRRGARP